MAGPKKFRPDWWACAVGERIAWIRDEAGLSQPQLGELLGCSQQLISDYETGNRDADPYLLSIMCARFKVTMDYFFRGEISGCDPILARRLLTQHPELATMHADMGRHMDNILSSGRARISNPR